MQYRPFISFLLIAIAFFTAVVVGVYAISLRSDDPVRDELQDIAIRCELIGADADALQARLNQVVAAHGIDYIISDRSRGDAFVMAGLRVQNLYRDTMKSDSFSTDDSQ